MGLDAREFRMSLPGPWREVEITPTKQPEEIPQETPAEPVEAPPEKVPAG